jgi:hypothetical protein
MEDVGSVAMHGVSGATATATAVVYEDKLDNTRYTVGQESLRTITNGRVICHVRSRRQMSHSLVLA